MPVLARFLGTHNGIDYSKAQDGGKTATPARQASGEGYGTTPGQLGAMPVGPLPALDMGYPVACVSSPPYEHSHVATIDTGRIGDTPGQAVWKQTSGDYYGTTPGQLGAMPVGPLACVVSPPYAEGLSKEHTYTDHAKRDKDSHRRIMTEKGIVDPFYGVTPGQLGAEPTTFWEASSAIMAEVAALLPPGAVAAWVVKGYVSKGKLVDFPGQWLKLCEAHGFTLVEEIHASLVEDHGMQEDLFKGAQRVQTERKSFFRRLAERKGSPRIDYETVLIMQTAGDSGGVCVVGSPPYGDAVNVHGEGPGMAGNARQRVAIAAGSPTERAATSAHVGYGTTPGNLGNMPVGSR